MGWTTLRFEWKVGPIGRVRVEGLGEDGAAVVVEVEVRVGGADGVELGSAVGNAVVNAVGGKWVSVQGSGDGAH